MKGHVARRCPNNSLYCEDVKKPFQHPGVGVAYPGSVEGHAVKNILLDTGSYRTLVHRDLVPDHKMLKGEAVTIRCAHGDTVLYPLAKLELEVSGRTIQVEAAVSETLPMAVLLETDVPELPELLGNGLHGEQKGHPTENSLAVSTRAQKKKQRKEENNYWSEEVGGANQEWRHNGRRKILALLDGVWHYSHTNSQFNTEQAVLMPMQMPYLELVCCWRRGEECDGLEQFRLQTR